MFMYTRTVGKFPDGWFDGKVIEPSFLYKTDELGPQKYKTLSNGKFVLKVKRDRQASVFYIWNDINAYYKDAKDQNK